MIITMTSTSRLIVNSLAQNVRTVINIVLSLYSTRLVLEILGQSDYGIYMLVAGVVSFLSYFTNAMVSTTQRHLSYSFGQNNTDIAKQIFANSLMINAFLGISLFLISSLLTNYLFNGLTLNIEQSKIEEASWVYLTVLCSLFFTFLTSPFRALLIAKENIVYISIIDILDGLLKLMLVLCLYWVVSHRLFFYACSISITMLFNLLALALYAKSKYQECTLFPKLDQWSSSIQKELFGFTTWTIYGSLCVFLRTQGIAIILNKSFGSCINASYGIAGQILGSVSFFSSAIINAFTPQIIKAEGAGDRVQMLSLSLKACKYCYFMLCLFALPLIFEMDDILNFWLGNAPTYSSLFCRVFLIGALFDQMTTGLNVANQALGRIRNYMLLIYSAKLAAVPLIWGGIYMQYELKYIFCIYLIFELLTAYMRLPYIVKTTGLELYSFIRQVLFPIVLPTLVGILVCYLMIRIPHFYGRFVITGISSAIVSIVFIWWFGLENSERIFAKDIINRFHKHANNMD